MTTVWILKFTQLGRQEREREGDTEDISGSFNGFLLCFLIGHGQDLQHHLLLYQKPPRKNEQGLQIYRLDDDRYCENETELIESKRPYVYEYVVLDLA